MLEPGIAMSTHVIIFAKQQVSPRLVLGVLAEAIQHGGQSTTRGCGGRCRKERERRACGRGYALGTSTANHTNESGRPQRSGASTDMRKTTATPVPRARPLYPRRPRGAGRHEAKVGKKP